MTARSMRTRFFKPWLLSLASFICTLWIQPASSAGKSSDISLQRMPPGSGLFFFTLDSDRVRAHLGWSAALWFDYQDEPLVIRTVGGNGRMPLVERESELVLAAGMGLFDILELQIRMPFIPYRSGSGMARDLESYSLADLAVQAKASLYDSAGLGLFAGAELTAPTGGGELSGETGVTFKPVLGAGIHRGPFDMVLNLWYRARKDVKDAWVDLPDELGYGLGFSVMPIDFIRLGMEVCGATAASDPWKVEAQNPLDLIGGVSFYFAGGLFKVSAAGGAGLLPGYGSPKWRARIGLSVQAPGMDDRDYDGIRNRLDKCPDDPEDKDGFQDQDGCPDYDNDNDKINDHDDKCPNDPEDKDGFQDQDGCPDYDNDNDKINDHDDKCPNDPETYNGVHDLDGCPEFDSDGDAVFDIDDKCPVDPEDKDGFQDQDGCPDYDNDRDGIPDSRDECPIDPEIINGVDDEDGCPDEGERQVEILGRKIALKQKIYFRTNSARISKRSYSILNQLAATLKAHDEIKLLRIEGHTDERGTRQFNQRLSEARAYAVRRYLIHRGISPFRLKAVGFGKERPLIRGRSKRAYAANRRVEFIIEIGDAGGMR